METVADDALSLAEGTATGVDAAGEALWGLTRDVAVWVSDLVLRQALAPVHEYRTSTRRVQAALDEQQAAQPQASSPPRSSAEKGVLVHSSVRTIANLLASCMDASYLTRNLERTRFKSVASGV